MLLAPYSYSAKRNFVGSDVCLYTVTLPFYPQWVSTVMHKLSPFFVLYKQNRMYGPLLVGPIGHCMSPMYSLTMHCKCPKTQWA
jgi:hypothetical protein